MIPHISNSSASQQNLLSATNNSPSNFKCSTGTLLRAAFFAMGGMSLKEKGDEDWKKYNTPTPSTFTSEPWITENKKVAANYSNVGEAAFIGSALAILICGLTSGGGGNRPNRPNHPYRSVRQYEAIPFYDHGHVGEGVTDGGGADGGGADGGGADFSIWEKVGWGALGTVALVGAGALALFPFDGPVGEYALGAASLALFAKAGLGS